MGNDSPSPSCHTLTFVFTLCICLCRVHTMHIYIQVRKYPKPKPILLCCWSMGGLWCTEATFHNDLFSWCGTLANTSINTNTNAMTNTNALKQTFSQQSQMILDSIAPTLRPAYQAIFPKIAKKCLKLHNIFVSNCKIYLSQITRYICFKLQNIFVSNCKTY